MVNIKVAVRIRPLSQRELLQGHEIVVRKENKSVVVTNPKIPERSDGNTRQRCRRFSVDFCYDPEDAANCDQEAVYNEIGSEVLDSMFEGYNACVLAYGHSASGKTYTIMGLQDDPGLTPRLCQGLFQRIGDRFCDGRIQVEVAASFLEIYNEKVKDLLGNEESGETSSNFSLRVREHPKLGPYVQGLSEHLVSDKRTLLGLLTSGNRKRSTAATENNIQSSRSHAIFSIHFKQFDVDKCETEKWSKVHLVDLAGSERATSEQTKARLQEGANINKSLVTLGNVISALAESLETTVQKELPGSKNWQPFVPYRDSVLTWLLKDTLGGNSNTIMIATISPASGCLSETVNTLRYAKRTKRIVNQAIVNEDPRVRTIRELRKEIGRLKDLLVSVTLVSAEGYNIKHIWQKWVTEQIGMNVTHTSGGGERKKNSKKSALKPSVGGHNVASVSEPLAGVTDEKESVVNGSANDTFSHESQIFSDSLESLESVFVKSSVSCDGKNETSRGVVGPKLDSRESIKKREISEMLRRSRPDLIKGISARYKEHLPSASSQSCTDVSNLSQSTSENSLNSSGSFEVQSLENKQAEPKNWRKEDLALKSRHPRAVQVVPTHLYVREDGAAKKQSNRLAKVAMPKENEEEGEKVKLCKRARMKLFDLSRKMTLKGKTKKTADSDTQTESNTGTVRVKEKSVEVNLTEVSKEVNDLTNSPPSKRGETGRGFAAVNLGELMRIEKLRLFGGQEETATQTETEEKSDKSANTSPVQLSSYDEDCFSDDSLDLQYKRKDIEVLDKPNAGKIATFTDETTVDMGADKYSNCLEKIKKESAKIQETEGHSFNGLPLTLLPDGHFASEQKGLVQRTEYSFNKSTTLGKKGNQSSDNFLNFAERMDFVPSSEISSADLVCYESPEAYLTAGTTALKDRELYTITESSEHSDPSDAFSPVPSQNYVSDIMETNKSELARSETTKHHVEVGNCEAGRIAVKSRLQKILGNRKSRQSEEIKSVETESLRVAANERRETNFCILKGYCESKDMTANSNVFLFKKQNKQKSGEQMEIKRTNRRLEESFLENEKAGHPCSLGKSNDFEGKKRTWGNNWRQNTNEQYLNLKIFNSDRGQVEIDSNLFEEMKKERGIDAMFTSADSLTLVFLGPANPKSSVLMEIIKRTLERSFPLYEIPSARRKLKSTAVQCDANLVRSVSLDTAMIALSRIARNQEQSSNIERAASLGALDVCEFRSMRLKEGNEHRETSCRCHMDSDIFNTKEEKIGIQSSLGTKPEFYRNAGSSIKKQKHESVEKSRKSVSWFGDTKCDIETESGLSGAMNQWEPRDAPISCFIPGLQGLSDEKSHCQKIEAESATNEFTIFLKEAIHLLKRINSSSSRFEITSVNAQEEQEENTGKDWEETETRAKKELLTRMRTENQVKGEGGGMGVHGDENSLSTMWPRRAAATGKPPTGIRGKFGRSVFGGRAEHSHFGCFSDCTKRSPSRSGSGGKSAVPVSGGSFHIEETQNRSPSFCQSEEFRQDEETYAPRVESPKLTLESLLEAETELEKCCHRLELAVEREEIREKILEKRREKLKCNIYAAKLLSPNRCSEEKCGSGGERVKTRIQRREERCAGGCTCGSSIRDPCKFFLNKSSQSSFELNSFGPGSKHCSQFCIFCRKKDVEQYSSALELNSECLFDLCRFNYYGYCPCSSIRLRHISSSPRAYMWHLLTLRRQIVSRTVATRQSFRAPGERRPRSHALSNFSSS